MSLIIDDDETIEALGNFTLKPKWIQSSLYPSCRRLQSEVPFLTELKGVVMQAVVFLSYKHTHTFMANYACDQLLAQGGRVTSKTALEQSGTTVEFIYYLFFSFLFFCGQVLRGWEGFYGQIKLKG